MKMSHIVEVLHRRFFLVVPVTFLGGVLVGCVLTNELLKLSSNFWYWYLWAIVSTSGILWLVTEVWDKAPGIAESPASERTGIGLVCMLGAIGGLVRWMDKLFENQNKSPGLDSLLWPLESAALSLIVILIFRAGVVSSSAAERSKVVNWVGLYAFAGLTGLFAHEAVQKLGEIFSLLLKTGPGSVQG